MAKKHKKCPKNVFFSPFVTPKIFFKNRAFVTFVPLWCPNLASCKNLEKLINSLIMDGQRTTDGQGRLQRTPSGKPEVQNRLCSWED